MNSSFRGACAPQQRLVLTLWLAFFSQLALAAEPIQLRWEKARTVAASDRLTSYALEIQDYANVQDADGLLARLGVDDFAARMRAQFDANLRQPDGKPFPPHEIQAVLAQLRPAVKNQFHQLFSAGQQWEFIRLRKYRLRQFLLYRVDADNGKYDFLEFEIAPHRQRWQVIDWYTHSTDKWASLAFTDTLTFSHRAQMAPSDEHGALLTYLRNKPDDLIGAFDKLAPRFRSESIIQSALLGFALRSANAQMAEVYQRLVAEAPANRFLLFKLNYTIEQGDSERALSYLTGLEKQLGGETQLSLQKAELFYDLGKSRQADRLLAKIIDSHRDRPLVFYTTLLLLAYYEKYDHAVLVLNALQQAFGSELTAQGLAQIDGLEGFLASDAFQRWAAQNL